MEGKLFIERARSVRRYFKYLREYKLHCILGPIAKWIEAVLELLVPLVMASIIDVGVAGGDVSYVLWGGAVMLAMGIVGFFCAIFCQRSASITSQGFGTNVRNALFSHINTLSGRELDKIGAASLLTRTVNDVNQMQNAVAMIIRLVVRAPFIALGSVILCMVIDWQIGLVVLAVAALVGAVLWIIMKKSVPYYTANQKKLDRLTQITNENLDTPIDFGGLQKIGSMMGSGGMIVMDEDDCIVDVAKFYLNFTVDESCGKCAPCRIGGKSLCNILEKITQGKGEESDIAQIEQIAHAMKIGSLCALGQTAPNPVLSTLHYFPEEYKAHIVDKKCPSGKCKKLISYEINPSKCIGCTACARKCPVGAISGEVKKPHKINGNVCIKCGVCKDTCKFSAIEIH